MKTLAEAAAQRDAAERSAEDWVNLAREASRRPRSTGFDLQPGGAEPQTGTSHFHDALHFRVETHSRMMRSRPDGPVEYTDIIIHLACDGEELRILLPETSSNRGTMMFLDAARMGELPSTSPGFTLEQLDPLHLTASLLDRFTPTDLERSEDGTLLLNGRIPDGTLADFGMGGTDVVDAGGTVQLVLDEETHFVVSLALHPVELLDGALQLEMPGLTPSTPSPEWTLALPQDAATMDLSTSLPEPSPQQD